MKILSIIVPSYNMEHYLPKCLGSVIVEDAELLQKLDVIVVNDGSKDRTSEIAHEFEKKYPGVFRVIDKENGHYGSCVNTALPLAIGKYVKVLDADDYVDNGTWREFLEWLLGCDADLVLSDFERVDPDGKILQTVKYPREVSVDARVNLFIDLHAITYRTDLFRRFAYHQTEGVMYSDTEWRLVPLALVRCVAAFPKPVVNYLVGRDGQSVEITTFISHLGQLGRVTLDAVAAIETLRRGGVELNRMIIGQVQDQIEDVYRYELLSKHRGRCHIDLRKFDEGLKTVSPEFYEQTFNVLVMGRTISVPVVSLYRKHPRCYRLLLSLLLPVYGCYSFLARFCRQRNPFRRRCME